MMEDEQLLVDGGDKMVNPTDPPAEKTAAAVAAAAAANEAAAAAAKEAAAKKEEAAATAATAAAAGTVDEPPVFVNDLVVIDEPAPATAAVTGAEEAAAKKNKVVAREGKAVAIKKKTAAKKDKAVAKKDKAKKNKAVAKKDKAAATATASNATAFAAGTVDEPPVFVNDLVVIDEPARAKPSNRVVSLSSAGWAAAKAVFSCVTAPPKRLESLDSLEGRDIGLSRNNGSRMPRSKSAPPNHALSSLTQAQTSAIASTSGSSSSQQASGGVKRTLCRRDSSLPTEDRHGRRTVTTENILKMLKQFLESRKRRRQEKMAVKNAKKAKMQRNASQTENASANADNKFVGTVVKHASGSVIVQGNINDPVNRALTGAVVRAVNRHRQMRRPGSLPPSPTGPAEAPEIPVHNYCTCLVCKGYVSYEEFQKLISDSSSDEEQE